MAISVEGYNQLVESNAKQLLYYARSFFKGENGVAEDIVQMSFLEIWNRRDSLESKNMKGYLFKTCRNKAIDLIRKRKGHETFNEEKLSNSPILKLDIDIDLKNILKRLNPNESELLILKYQMGMTLKEIGEVLNKTPNNVGVEIHRILIKLKNEHQGQNNE